MGKKFIFLCFGGLIFSIFLNDVFRRSPFTWPQFVLLAHPFTFLSSYLNLLWVYFIAGICFRKGIIRWRVIHLAANIYHIVLF